MRRVFICAAGVTHISYDTTSILATIEHRWGLAALSTRDAAVDAFTPLFAGHQRR